MCHKLRRKSVEEKLHNAKLHELAKCSVKEEKRPGFYLTCARWPLTWPGLCSWSQYCVLSLVTTSDDTPLHTSTHMRIILEDCPRCQLIICVHGEIGIPSPCELSPWQKPPWTSERHTSLLLVSTNTTTEYPCSTLSHPQLSLLAERGEKLPRRQQAVNVVIQGGGEMGWLPEDHAVK